MSYCFLLIQLQALCPHSLSSKTPSIHVPQKLFVLGALSALTVLSDTCIAHFLTSFRFIQLIPIKAFLESIHISAPCPLSFILVHSAYQDLTFANKHFFLIFFPILKCKLHKDKNFCVLFVESPVCRTGSASY